MAFNLSTYNTLQRPLTKAEMDANWTAIINAMNTIIAAQAKRVDYILADGKHISYPQLVEASGADQHDVEILAVIQGTKSFDFATVGDGVDLSVTLAANTRVSVIYRLDIVI